MKVMTLEGLGLYTPPHSYTPNTVMPSRDLAMLRGLGSFNIDPQYKPVVGAVVGGAIAYAAVKLAAKFSIIPAVGVGLLVGWLASRD